MAERNAAIHRAGPLLAELALRQVVVEFVPILHPFNSRTVKWQLAEVFGEAGRFTHGGKCRNPNTEIRKKSECRSPNAKARYLRARGIVYGSLLLRISSFGFPSEFGIRFSDFFAHPPPMRATSRTFSSNAAMIASSPLRPDCSTFFNDCRMRL